MARTKEENKPYAELCKKLIESSNLPRSIFLKSLGLCPSSLKDRLNGRTPIKMEEFYKIATLSGYEIKLTKVKTVKLRKGDN